MKIAIIGNGPAASYAIESFRKIDKDSSIILFSAEKHFPYAPNCMENVIRQDIKEEALFFKGKENFYKKHNVEAHLDEEVIYIDPDTKIIKTKKGNYSFDKALIAAGTYSFVPSIPGKDLYGVSCAKTLDEAIFIRDFIKSGKVKDAVIIGAGPIGVEDAETLLSMGINVSIVEIANRVLPRMLDDEMATIYKNHLEEEGIKFYLGHQVIAFHGKEKVETVEIKELETDKTKFLKADLVILSTGVRPRTSISNLELHKIKDRVIGGFLVNEFQQTSHKDIYAAGDIASSIDVFGENRWIALFPAAVQTGIVAGLNMAGLKVKNNGTVDYNAVKTRSIPAGSGGVFEEAENSIKFELDNSLVKLFIKNDTVIGYQFLGKPSSINKKNRFLNFTQKNQGIGLESSGVIFHRFIRQKAKLTSFYLKALERGNIRALFTPSKEVALFDFPFI